MPEFYYKKVVQHQNYKCTKLKTCPIYNEKLEVVKQTLDEHENNLKRVLDYIDSHPGCHLRQIKNELKIAMGTVQYHLNNLERSGKIISERQNWFKCYFISGLFKESERNILKVLNQETSRRILLFILERKKPTQSEIVGELHMAAPSIHWHVKRLVESQVILESKEGKYTRYQVAGNSSQIIKILKQYHPSLWNKWSDNIAEMFLSFGTNEDKKNG